MKALVSSERTKLAPRLTGVVIVLGAVIAGLAVLWQTNVHPRTDDATVYANLIGIAPEVDGPLEHLYARDNQLVKQGDLLFEIDPRPYQYALERAKSEQFTLEKRIVDLAREISAQHSAVQSAEAVVETSQAKVFSASAAVNAARANVANAKAGVTRAEAEYRYANDNLNRVEPLLVKQFVTTDDVDRVRTDKTTKAEALRQSRIQVDVAQAQLEAALADANQSKATLSQSHAQAEQSVYNVTTLNPLTAQRGAMEAAVRNAQYNLDRCQVRAPFDARVTDLTISEGAYGHTGQRVFTLIDVRTWWAIGNYREGQLKYIRPGMRADVYAMANPTRRFEGVVDSAGFGVTPEENSTTADGLPNIQRSLNWVHLATRFPVRIRILQPEPDLFRIGESAVVIVRNEAATRR